MIFIGYPGIGKSTLGGCRRFIDLDSSNFTIEGQKMDKWYVPYTSIAQKLSEQGYNIFISSHPDVQQALKNNKDVFTITPDLSLKEKWLKKLQERYENSMWDPKTGHNNFVAYCRALDHFEDDIAALLKTSFKHIIIEDMNYDLSDILYNYINKKGE